MRTLQPLGGHAQQVPHGFDERNDVTAGECRGAESMLVPEIHDGSLLWVGRAPAASPLSAGRRCQVDPGALGPDLRLDARLLSAVIDLLVNPIRRESPRRSSSVFR